ncbi:MAG: outer membrane beta-barrel protein [Bacteroidaceae bacterium]|nr:outer membrane beta-barrel protein [Bacteroidaceae bacterium]
MKKFGFIIAMLMLVSTNFKAFAQEATDPWQGFNVSYNYNAGGYDVNVHGISVGYLRGFSLSSSTPIFIETGLNFAYGRYSEDYGGYDAYVDQLNLSLPVNFAYKFQLSDNVALIPYTGVYFRVNLMANLGVKGYDLSESLFDYIDGPTRFNAGWQIGLKTHIKKFMVGVCYGTDFNKYMGDVRFDNLSVNVGFNF